MLRRTRRLFSVPLCATLIAGAAPAAHAAELGEPRVSSHIGQQLVADIELTLLEDAGTPVQARLASPEIYSEAGVAVPSALSSLNLSVMRRDGRQFLHATTLRPVDADHLHLYLELVDHGQRVVRLATLWLTPDPNPAPAALPAPAPAPVPAAPAHVSAPVAAAQAYLPAHAPAPAPVRARVEVDAAPALARAPAPAHAQAAPKMAPPAPAPKPVPPLPIPRAAPLPMHALLPAPARPAACAPQSSEAQACVVLGARNAELRTRIGQLEQRVKGLQANLGAGRGKPGAGAQKPPAAHVQEPKPVPPPAGPAPIASIKPLVPHKPKAAPPEADLPWGMIGAALAALAVLAALGGAAALVRARRKRAPRTGIPAAPGVLPRLRERFFTGNGGKAPVDPASKLVAEPTLK